MCDPTLRTSTGLKALPCLLRCRVVTWTPPKHTWPLGSCGERPFFLALCLLSTIRPRKLISSWGFRDPDAASPSWAHSHNAIFNHLHLAVPPSLPTRLFVFLWFMVLTLSQDIWTETQGHSSLSLLCTPQAYSAHSPLPRFCVSSPGLAQAPSLSPAWLMRDAPPCPSTCRAAPSLWALLQLLTSAVEAQKQP